MSRGGLLAVIFGPPGAGKGTQSGFICDTFDLSHVSTGDMLRAEVSRGSEIGREVEPIMAEGGLVPDELVVRAIETRLGEDDGHGGILLDGFPRTLPQAEALDAMLRRAGRRLDVLLFLDVPGDELVARVLRRSSEESRSDDDPETLRRRLEVYESETAPVVEHYESSGANVQHVDGVGSLDEVRQRIRSALATAARDGVA